MTTDYAGADDGKLDLTPRDEGAPVVRPTRPPAQRWLAIGVLVAVGLGLAFVTFRTLGDAALFFRNADEAVEQRSVLGESRFRIQGTPYGEVDAVEIVRDGRAEPAVVFSISFNDQPVDVVHVGNPAELFQPGVPVVLEGRWERGMPDGVEPVPGGAADGWHFASTDMVVKHDNEYRNDNGARLDEANQGGAQET